MTGVAWPSSARVVRCWVKSRNERNPYRLLQFQARLPGPTGRKVGSKSGQHGPYALGYTRATMAGTMRLPTREGELIVSKPVSVRIGGCNSPP
jgi:hypothetical protein